MNKTARKKPAVLKIARGSSTSVRIQGPFPRSRKTPSSARSSTNRGATKGKSDQASTTPGPQISVPVSPDRTSMNRDRSGTREPLPKAKEPLSSMGKSANLPKTKIPIFSGYGNKGNKGNASKAPGPVQTESKKPVNSGQTYTSSLLVIKDSDTESSEAFACPSAVHTPELKASESAYPASLEESEGFPGLHIPQKQATSPIHHKSKIPISSESRISVLTPGLQANKPIVAARAEKTQGVKFVESSSSVSRNRGSSFRYPSVVQTQLPVLPTRTPTSPCILQNRRPNANESVTSVVRNRGSLSTSPSYIRRPKPSVSFNTTREPETKKPVSSVGRSFSKNPTPLQTKRPLPKSSEPVSSVKRNLAGASTSPGTIVSSKRASTSPASAQAPGNGKANESVSSSNKDKDLASKSSIILRTRIPVPSPGAKGKQLSNTEPKCCAKQNIKSPDRKSRLAPKTNLALETQLADELDRRNRSINELEMKLVQNENLVSEQALRLAEIKADQRAKDVAMEQLKSELLSTKYEYDRMHLLLMEADFGLEQATCKVNKYLERSTSFEDELKEARDKIVNLQVQLKDAETKAKIHCQIKAQLHKDVERLQEQLALDSKRIDSLQQSEKDLREDLEKRDRVIKQINQELATRDEEFRNLFETLQNKHTQLRNQELSIKRLEERYERSSLNRSKLEERNAALLDKIQRLKHNLRYYSQMIIANDGKPFYEEVPPGINPHIGDGLDPSPEEEQQQKRKPKPKEK